MISFSYRDANPESIVTIRENPGKLDALNTTCVRRGLQDSNRSFRYVRHNPDTWSIILKRSLMALYRDIWRNISFQC